MDRPSIPPSLLLPIAAVPLGALFPPSAWPSVFPLILLLLAPGLVHAARRGMRPPLHWWALAGGGLGLSWLFASYRHQSLLTLLTVLAGVAAWVSGRRLGEDGRRLLLQVTALTGGAVALQGLWQATFGLERDLEAARQAGLAAEVVQRLAAGRAFAGFPLPSQLGAFLLLGLAATAALALGSRRRGEGFGVVGWLLLLLALLQVAGLVATLSLGAFLAAGAGAGYLFARRLSRRAFVLAAVALVVVCVAGAGLALARRTELSGDGARHNPVTLRLGNWAVALEMVRDHPLAGVGPGCFGTRYPQYMREGMNETRYAHSVPLQALAESGLWLLAPLLLGGAALVRRGAGASQTEEVLVGAGILAFAAANLWDFHLYLPSLAVPFFLLAGSWFPLGAAPGTSSRTGLLASLAAAALLAACALLLALGDFRRQATMGAFQAGRLEAAGEAAQGWAHLAPLDADPRALQAELALATGGSREGATRLFEEAVRLDPWTPFRRARLARHYLSIGDRSGALVEAAAAARLFPARKTYGERLQSLAPPAPGGGEP